MNPNRRKQLLILRRRIKVMRRFSVELVEGSTFKYTCRTCGQAETRQLEIPQGFAVRFARYQNSGGVSAVCPHCTKTLRDERFPLVVSPQRAMKSQQGRGNQAHEQVPRKVNKRGQRNRKNKDGPDQPGP